jgi:hypothetical protein
MDLHSSVRAAVREDHALHRPQATLVWVKLIILEELDGSDCRDSTVKNGERRLSLHP